MRENKRLIDANVLKVLFDVRYDTAFIQERTRENKEQWNGYCTGINWGRNTIVNAPTVDAVEVVHGQWDDDGRCTRCGKYMPFDCEGNAYESIYCPDCGAVMAER